MSNASEELSSLLQDSLERGTLRKAVFSKPVDKSSDVARRLDVRPVRLGDDLKYQLTFRIGNQEHHRNLTAGAAVIELASLPQLVYRDILIKTHSEEVTARHSRKGVCTMRRNPVQSCDVPDEGHDRGRAYLIPDHHPVPFLVATGIMSSNGNVRSKFYRKFRQINRYVEILKGVVEQLPDSDPLHIVDFGCGKSYLTFAAQYLLSELMGRNVEMVGLDIRGDVIDSCNQMAIDLGIEDIRFQQGDIAAFRPLRQVNVAISLHACDTATDDALAVAAQWKADAILAVPCCQHELAATLASGREPVLSRHGILHERFSSLATDAIRASLMECIGYSTSVIEFVDTEHTPKNLLIRAIRRRNDAADSPDPQYWHELQQFSGHLELPPLKLQRKLEEWGLLRTKFPPTIEINHENT